MRQEIPPPPLRRARVPRGRHGFDCRTLHGGTVLGLLGECARGWRLDAALREKKQKIDGEDC